MPPTPPTRPGSSLLLAILIVAITLGTAVTLASLIIQALARAGTSAEAASLLYAAESGLERQLYLARKQKVVPAITAPRASLPCDLPGAGAPTCQWKNPSPSAHFLNGSPVYPPAPARDAAVQVFIAVGDTIDPELHTSCTDADTTNGIAAWVEITRLQVSSDNGLTWQINPDATTVFKQYYPCGTTPLETPLLQNYNYIVRVRALYDATSQVQVRAFSGSQAVAGVVRGHQTLTVTATGGRAQQVVKATFPATPAAVGFTDYVLFSECSIKKGVPGALACL